MNVIDDDQSSLSKSIPTGMSQVQAQQSLGKASNILQKFYQEKHLVNNQQQIYGSKRPPMHLNLDVIGSQEQAIIVQDQVMGSHVQRDSFSSDSEKEHLHNLQAHRTKQMPQTVKNTKKMVAGYHKKTASQTGSESARFVQ
jgi:hypothetical protein